MKVPVDVYQCVLEGIHLDPEVLVAMTEADNDSMFKEPSVQALITLGWMGVRLRYTRHFFINLIFALILLYVRLLVKNVLAHGALVWARRGPYGPCPSPH